MDSRHRSLLGHWGRSLGSLAAVDTAATSSSILSEGRRLDGLVTPRTQGHRTRGSGLGLTTMAGSSVLSEGRA
jgi:hypothetical protein